MIDPEESYFPEPGDSRVAPFGSAFVALMFAHTAFEARIRAVQEEITGEAGFGEKRVNQWGARDRSRQMKQLAAKHLKFAGSSELADRLADCLSRATPLSDFRNLLAHGEWWRFDPRSSTITVRSGTDRPGEDQNRDLTVQDIGAVTAGLLDIEVELYGFQSEIEEQLRANRDLPS